MSLQVAYYFVITPVPKRQKGKKDSQCLIMFHVEVT